MLDTGEARLFSTPDAALVAVVEEHPQYLALCLWLAGGNLDDLVHRLRPDAEAWGLSEGCTRSTILGRRGWIKALQPLGYAATSTILTKDLR